jgi:hypothetical protein
VSPTTIGSGGATVGSQRPFPGLQAKPAEHTTGANAQPVAGRHASVVHRLPSVQTTAVPGWHEPPPQASPVVQALPSSQAFVLFVKTQPEAGAHVSFVQALLSLQTTAVPG